MAGHKAGDPLECFSIPLVLNKDPEIDDKGQPINGPDGNQKFRCGFRIGGGIDQDNTKSPQGYPDKGVYVTYIHEGGPAARCGLQVHDKILQVLETFVYQPVQSAWKNEQISRLGIQSQVFDRSEDNISSSLLTRPTAIHAIVGDGNCFFRALSYALTEEEEHYHLIRLAICQYMKENPNELESILPIKFVGDVQCYLSHTQMERNTIWATEVEIMAAAALLKTNIFIYSKSGVHWKWIRHTPCNITVNHGIYLYHRNENHFEVVLAVENAEVPSHLSEDKYYLLDSDIRKRRQERMKETMSKKYKSNERFRNTKKQRQKDSYIQDQKYRVTKQQRQKDRYSQDQKYRVTKQQRQKDRYSQDQKYRVTKQQRQKDRYSQDQKYRVTKQQRQKDRYTQDQKYRVTKQQRQKDRYSQDQKYRVTKQQRQNDRYSHDQKYRDYKVRTEKNKYKLCEDFKNKKLQSQKLRYASNPVFAAKKKQSVKERYWSIESYRRKKKCATLVKYCTNSMLRNTLRQLSKQKYLKDSLHRHKVKEYSKQKYSNDSLHRHKVKEYSKQKYQRFDVFRNNMKASSIKKYATNPLFRHSLKCYLKNSYHQSISLKQEKKKRVAISRRSIVRSIQTFKKSINDSPKHICRVCIRLLYRNQVKKLIEKRYCEPKSGHLKEIAEKCFIATFSHNCDDDTCTQNCWMKILSKDQNWICHTCDRHLKQGNMPPQAQANNLYSTPIPTELANLNVLERQLIALRIPFMKLLSLPRGGQKGVKGPVVNVPSDITSVTTALPRNLSDAQLIKVKLKRKSSYKGHYTFNWINPLRVVDAIKYLKESNIWYKDVTIDESWLESNEDEDLLRQDPDDTESDTDEESAEESTTAQLPVETCFQPIDIGQEVLDTNRTLCVAPAEKQTPQNIFQEDGSDAMAFPTLLPDGHFGLFEQREIKLTPSKYFNARLLSADYRFSTNKEYVFFAQYVTEINKISSNISLALRKGKQTTEDGKPITASMLLDADHIQNILKSDVGFRFLQPVRGTPPYWQRTMKDLYAMIHQLGIPTWFVTFSSAEMRWHEVLKTLLYLNNDSRDPDDVDWSEKCSLITDNPVICARMFDHRVKALFSDLIMSPSCPLGKVADYFFRTEFQQRGSPHIHCLLWIQDAPKLNENTDKEICNFIDQYVTCKMPNKETDPELFNIISTVQVHSKTHSKSCKKYSSTCRFNFPRPPIRKTFIARCDPVEKSTELKQPPSTAAELDEISKAAARNPREILRDVWMLVSSVEQTNYSMSEILKLANVTYSQFKQCLTDIATRNTVHIKRDLSDIWVNNFNEHLSRAWNANLDIQYVTDAYACVAYILSYISKAETEMGDLLQNAQKEADEGNIDAASALKKIGYVYLQNREVSAQEAIYRVCGLHLKQCTREVVFIPAGKHIFRMSLPISVIKSRSKQAGEDENIWMASIHEKYYARPHHPDFDSMSLAEFVSKFFILPRSQKPKSKKSSVFTLSNDIGYIKRRKCGKEAVIRYPKFRVEKNPEEFYLTLMQLFLPHRNQITVPPGSQSYEDYVKNGSVNGHQVFDIIEKNKNHFESDTENLEKAWEDVQEGRIQEESWASIAPQAEADRLETIMEKSVDTVEELEEIPELRLENESRNRTSNFCYEPPKLSLKEMQQALRSMNDTQQQVFYSIKNWSLKVLKNEKPDPFFVFLTGGAGTGKSHLIRCIYHETTRILSKFTSTPDSAAVLLTAPTGTAAFNIQGMTIHSAFAINKNVTLPYQPLGENLLNTLRSKFESLQILIIDEISMVDQKILTYIHGRLSQIKHSKQPFGKVSILAVGDFYQLPPVRGFPLYKKRQSNFADLWNDHFSIVTLTEVMRQKDDYKFADMLNRLRIHVRRQPLMEEDLNTLLEASKQETPADAINALHIFPTNQEVNAHNNSMIEKVCTTFFTSTARDFYTNRVTGHLHQKDQPLVSCTNEDLQTELKMGIGARVMLTRNIDTEDGLVNGAFGTVIGADFSTSGQVAAIYVKFDNSVVGKNHMRKLVVTEPSLRGSVRIKPVQDALHGKKVTRKQLPLKLAWAATIHKVQGMTMEQVVVSLKKIFQPGMAYVALSRATSLAGLHILHFDPDTIYSSDNITEALQAMPPFLPPQPSVDQYGFVIIHHNTEGLLPHLQDIQAMKQFQLADVICFTETWVSKDHSIPAILYPKHELYHLARSEAYTRDHGVLSKTSNMERGGVAIFVNQKHLQKKFDFKTTNLEAVGTIVNSALFVAVYRPPSYPFQLFLENFTLLLREIRQLSIPSMIVGDFNVNILQPGENKLTKKMEEFDYKQLVNVPTTEGGTCLDLVFVNGFLNNCSETVFPTFYSYHDAVKICVDYTN